MYKLILLDYGMAGMDGPETAIKIHSIFREFKVEHPEIRCSMPHLSCLTSFSGTEFRKKALAAGINDYLLKPLNDEDLTDTLKKSEVRNFD